MKHLYTSQELANFLAHFLGMYVFAESDDDDRHPHIFVYSNSKERYQELIAGLPALFEDFEIVDETIEPKILDEMVARCEFAYFDVDMVPPYNRQDIENLLQYFARNKSKPFFISHESICHRNIAISLIAKEIIEKNLHGSEQNDYIDSLWGDENSFFHTCTYSASKPLFKRNLEKELLKHADYLVDGDVAVLESKIELIMREFLDRGLFNTTLTPTQLAKVITGHHQKRGDVEIARDLGNEFLAESVKSLRTHLMWLYYGCANEFTKTEICEEFGISPTILQEYREMFDTQKFLVGKSQDLPEYPHKFEAKKEEENVTLDFEKINDLRSQSDDIRADLHVKESDSPIEKVLLSDLHKVTLVYIALTIEARNLLHQIIHLTLEYEYKQEDEPLILEINRLAERYLGCALLIKENDGITVESDFRDELEHIRENPPHLPDVNEPSTLFNLSILPPNLKEIIEHLIPEQQKALHAVLTCENPQKELKQIAEGAMTMPQLLLDEINYVAMQILGDILIDPMNEQPHIIDEYVLSLEMSIAKEKSDSSVLENKIELIMGEFLERDIVKTTLTPTQLANLIAAHHHGKTDTEIARALGDESLSNVVNQARNRLIRLLFADRSTIKEIGETIYLEYRDAFYAPAYEIIHEILHDIDDGEREISLIMHQFLDKGIVKTNLTPVQLAKIITSCHQGKKDIEIAHDLGSERLSKKVNRARTRLIRLRFTTEPGMEKTCETFGINLSTLQKYRHTYDAQKSLIDKLSKFQNSSEYQHVFDAQEERNNVTLEEIPKVVQDSNTVETKIEFILSEILEQGIVKTNLTPTQLAKLIAAYHQGKNDTEIAYILGEENLQISPESVKKAKIDLMRLSYKCANESTIDKISEEFGISPSTLQEYRGMFGSQVKRAMNLGLKRPMVNVEDQTKYVSQPLSTIRETEPEFYRKIEDDLYTQARESYGYSCALCSRISPYKALFKIDYIVPISKGGKTEINNLRLLCTTCNQEHGNKWD
ncbi:MAG: HNH endonuclease [Streptococcaceae bacterium]|nr:HNH endonuclease [Streptococcaceae bacterium]